jgi:uncharacterized protein (DUF2141 family)
VSRAWPGLACLALVWAASPLALAGQGVPPSTTQAEGAARSVLVELINVRNARGQLLSVLFRDPRGFPDGARKAYARRAQKARAGAVQVRFEGVPDGPFAISVLHDEDSDFRMDTGLFGIPTEGYGFSRNAHAPFGPPSFDDCKLFMKPGQRHRLRIQLRY